MSMHFSKPNYECPECRAIFLPYKIGIKCPNCGASIPDADCEQYLNTIENITGSMEVHKLEHGTYFPGGWATMNIMDHVQSIIFRLFDTLEHEKPENEEDFLVGLLENNFQWGSQVYLKNHIKEITKRVLVTYKDKEFSKMKPSMLKEKVESRPEIESVKEKKISKIRKLFNDLFYPII